LSKITKGTFEELYEAYHAALFCSGNEFNWNSDVDDYSRSVNALRESEMFLARVDLKQAVINRIIVRLVSEGISPCT